jgi:hypothetical protein
LACIQADLPSGVVGRRHNGVVARPDDTLVAQIERDALDDGVPVATALRKCVALGGKSGSEELRDWATRELQGYHGEDILPEYRVIAAPLMVDAVVGRTQVTHQQIPPSGLPDFAQEHISERLELRDGVGSLEAFARQPQIKISPPRAADLARLMNAKTGSYQHIISIYWSVAPPVMRGVVDQIRTALTQLVAELRANMNETDEIPSAEAASQAVNVVVTGKRSQVKVTTAQASGSDAVSVAHADEAETEGPPESGFWSRSRKLGAFLVGLATIAGAVVAIVQLH